MEHFSPKAPDPFIVKDADQGLAKFGHLNAIVDAVTVLQNNAAAETKVYTVSRLLSGDEILALNTTAIELVPAPTGLGDVAIAISALMAYGYSGAPFATHTELDIIHSGSTVAMFKADISQAANTYAMFSKVATPPAAGDNIIANAAINAFVPGGNPTAGGGAIQVTVSYIVVNYLPI